MQQIRRVSFIGLAMAIGLGLSACASTSGPSVRTWVEPTTVVTRAPVVVRSNDEAARWAAEQALREQGWTLASSGQARWQLEVLVRESIRVRPGMYDPFCGRSHWGWPHDFYWSNSYRWRCDPFWNEPRATPVREVVWVLGEAQGPAVWSASARESSLDGPPLRLSRGLAQSLGERAYGTP